MSAARALALTAATAADADALFDALPGLLQLVAGCGPVFAAAVDPTTLHFTRAGRSAISDEAAAAFFTHESDVDDVVTFRSLAASRTPVDTLWHATAGRPQSSARWRDLIEPLGWGDELRVAVREGARTWAFLCLHRAASDPPFSAAEVKTVRAVVPALADTFRRIARGSPSTGWSSPPGPGVVLLDQDFVVTSLTGAAAEWLDLLGDNTGGLPILLMSVAAQAHTTQAPAVVRTITGDGRWVTAHAAPLCGGQPAVAIVLEPAHPADALPTLAALVQLTPRETEVTAAALRGMSDRAIARSLHLGERTVQDHLKWIYTKAGVRSRGELVARLLTT